MEGLLRKWMIKACNVVSNQPHFVITPSVMIRESEMISGVRVTLTLTEESLQYLMIASGCDLHFLV